MKSIISTISLFTLWIHVYPQKSIIDSLKRSKNCDYKIINNPDGSKKEEGCMLKGLKHGIWVGYGIKFNYTTTYVNGIKNGPFKSYYLTGELREIGTYKDDSRVDTTLTFKQNGDTIAKFYSEPVKKGTSVIKWRKYYDQNAKPDGTFEKVGKINYMWQLGEMIEFKLKK